MRRLILTLLIGAAALVGCERREATPPEAAARQSAFSHRLEGDVSGDYRPVSETAETRRIKSLFIGQASAFEAWEAGRRGASPLILTLDGPDGAVVFTPRAYQVTDGGLSLIAVAPGGAEARLSVRIDQGALATARRNLGDTTPVITGTLTIDGRSLPVSLGWWNGD